MAQSKRSGTGGAGRRVLLAIGATYVVLAAAWALTRTGRGVPGATVLIIFLLIAAPGAGIAYGGYRLPRTDIRPELYSGIVRWCLGGLVVMSAILAFYSLQPGEIVDSPSTILILTALGSFAGFAAGIHDARAESRARELEETVEALRDSNERLEQFAHAASHDLQEPLRMVSSYLQLLEHRYADDLDEDAREFIGFAVDGADRMRAMIESLLEYSRVGSREAPLEPIDAGEVLDDVLEDLHLRIEETDATVTAEELPTVTADRDQLGQLFRNLLSNALEYSGDGSPRIHVSVERADSTWQFSVTDEGIGIDPQYQDRIFEVFERLDADRGESEGVAGGIGLAICQRIVERHGGDIRVESEPGEGATFYFTLPVSDGQRSESGARPSARP